MFPSLEEIEEDSAVILAEESTAVDNPAEELLSKSPSSISLFTTDPAVKTVELSAEHIDEEISETIMKEAEMNNSLMPAEVKETYLLGEAATNCLEASKETNPQANQSLGLKKVNDWKNVLEDFKQMHSSLNQDLDSIFRGLEEFLNAQHALLDEIIRKGDEMYDILKKADEIGCPKRIEIMHLVKACVDASRSMKSSAYPRMTNDFKLIASDVSKVKNIFEQLMSQAADVTFDEDESNSKSDDSVLVTVTHIVDPGEFYVVRCCDKEKHATMSSTLETEAPTYQEPFDILKGQMYAVFSSKWYRGLCGQQCGICQVGDKPPQKLYSFLLVDEGREETVPSSSVRCLPDTLAVIPRMALRCTLNPDFELTIGNMDAANRFKQATQRYLLSMKIISQDSGTLNVDLSQVLSFDENHIASLRNELFKVLVPFRRYKPKYDVVNCAQPLFLRVIVSFAQNPANIYVNVVDEESFQYEKMQNDLLEELAEASAIPPQEILKGLVCAAQFEGQWYRVLVEEFTFEGKVSIFFVDTGHRSNVPKDCCYRLPDRFLELPAQSLRCVLDGLKSVTGARNRYKPQKTNKWARETLSYIRGINGKQGILGIEYLRGRMVGKLDLSTELTAFSILYIDGDEFSVNHLLCRQGLASTNKKIVIPDIERLRLELAPEIAVLGSASAKAGCSDSKQSTRESTGEPAIGASQESKNSKISSEAPLSTIMFPEEASRIVPNSLPHEEDPNLTLAPCEHNFSGVISQNATLEECVCISESTESAKGSCLSVELGELALSECTDEAIESAKGSSSSVGLQEVTTDECISTSEATDSIQGSSFSVNLQGSLPSIGQNSTDNEISVLPQDEEAIETKQRERKGSTQSVDAANCSIFSTRTGRSQTKNFRQQGPSHFNPLPGRNRGFSFSNRKEYAAPDSKPLVEEGLLGNKGQAENVEASVKKKRQKKPRRSAKDKGSKNFPK